LSNAEIQSGICGFKTLVSAQRNGGKVKLHVESECDAIQRLAAELTEVEPFQEITFRGEGPLTLKAAAKHCYHPACPVPVGIIKTIEVEAGLALPADVAIKIYRSEE
jgi:hypothetical protein